MTPNFKLTAIASEYWDYYQALMACDPSKSEDDQAEFFEIQQWGERIERTARRYGFTWEQIEEAAHV